MYKRSPAHSNADVLSRLPLPNTAQSTPLLGEVVLMLEQLEDVPVTADQIRTWTWWDPTLSCVMQLTQSGWPSHIQHGEDQLKPIWRKHMELSAQYGCLLWGN